MADCGIVDPLLSWNTVAILEFAVYEREECESYYYKTLLCWSNI
jgi:hypothetical protein